MLLGPVADGVGGVVNSLSAYFNRRFQERMMRQQREWQLEDWNRQNNYNSPSAVMARMASAGLNPDLLAGGNNSTATVPAQGSAPQGSQSHPMSQLGTQAAVQAMLSNKLVESEINLNNANARHLDEDTELGRADIDLRSQAQKLQERLADSNIKFNDAQIEHLSKQADLLFQQIESVKLDNVRKDFDNNHLEQIFNMTVEAHRSQMKLTEAQIKKLQQDFEQSSERFIKELVLLQQDIDKGERDKARQQYDDFYANYVCELMKSDNFFVHGAGVLMRAADKFLDRFSFGLSGSASRSTSSSTTKLLR